MNTERFYWHLSGQHFRASQPEIYPVYGCAGAGAFISDGQKYVLTGDIPYFIIK